MSFLQRGINVIKGKISLLQEKDSVAERQKVNVLEKELEQKSSLTSVSRKGSNDTPETSSEPEETLPNPLNPRERTI